MKKRKKEDYQGFQQAGIRLAEKTLPNIVTHSSRHELPQLYACHMFDKAHLVMLAEEEIIPKKDAVLMLQSLKEMEQAGVEKTCLDVDGGIHSGEHFLINRLSEDIGGRIHVGRSSGDIDKVADRIKMRDSLLEIMKALNEFWDVLLKAAGQHADIVMPGHTHGQQSQPTTLGHHFLAWAAVLSRDFERFESAYHRINRSPAGAAIMTGSDFPINRHRTADLLGFEKPLENTLDAVHSSDDLLEVFSVIAILHSSIGRWTEDLIFWSTTEINMVELPDRFCGTSSILVQKKNPYALEHVRGSVAETVGGLTTAFYGEKGITGLAIFSRNRYSKQVLLRSFDNVLRDLGWFSGLIPDLKVNKELMQHRAGAYWAQATDIAGAIVREKGLPWRTAHQISGIMIRLSLERGINPAEVETSLLDESAVKYMGEPLGLKKETLKKALDPVAFVERRTLYGGPAPEESRKRINESFAMLDRNKKTVDEMCRRSDKAAEKLETAIDKLIEGSEREVVSDEI